MIWRRSLENKASREDQEAEQNNKTSHCFFMQLSLLQCSDKCVYQERKNKRQHSSMRSDTGTKSKNEPHASDTVFKIPSGLLNTFI